MAKANTVANKRFLCPNPYCGKAFAEPKIIKVCPHCYAEIKKETENLDCPHFFGYLGLKEDNKGIPEECNECTRTIECLLKKRKYSRKAMTEIKRWF
jgi:hypothetical protein